MGRQAVRDAPLPGMPGVKAARVRGWLLAHAQSPMRIMRRETARVRGWKTP